MRYNFIFPLRFRLKTFSHYLYTASLLVCNMTQNDHEIVDPLKIPKVLRSMNENKCRHKLIDPVRQHSLQASIEIIKKNRNSKITIFTPKCQWSSNETTKNKHQPTNNPNKKHYFLITIFNIIVRYSLSVSLCDAYYNIIYDKINCSKWIWLFYIKYDSLHPDFRIFIWRSCSLSVSLSRSLDAFQKISSKYKHVYNFHDHR